MPSSRQNARAQRELYSQILEGDVLIFQIDDLLVLKATNGSYCLFSKVSLFTLFQSQRVPQTINNHFVLYISFQILVGS